MSTRVVVLAADGRGEAGVGLAPPTTRPLVHPLAQLDVLPERLEPGVHVLVLAERRDAALLGRACSLVAASGVAPVTGRALEQGPLAVRLLADLVATSGLPPAVAVADLETLAGATWSGAWLPTVARLDAPAPSLWQHLRSWLPGGPGFLVEHAPGGVVRSAGASASEGSSAHGPSVRPVLVVAGRGAPDAALDLAQHAAAARARTAVAPLDGVAARYGTEAAVELAALPDSVPPLPRGAGQECPTCGLHVPQSACPFCRRTTAAVALAGGS